MAADSDFEPDEVIHFIDAAQAGGLSVFHGLETRYRETDAIHAVGQIYRFDTTNADSGVTSALNTNDGLDCMACSGDGSLWVGSVWGRVWTTADVDWNPSDIEGMDWEADDPDLTWKATEIPRVGQARLNVAAIWAPSDQDVHVGTFEGRMLHWDGAQWQFTYAEDTRSVIRMHGTGANDVWAVGRDGLVLHFDGQRWQAVPLPGDVGKGETLTGVWSVSPDEVYICSTSGTIFHGSRHSLTRLGEYPHAFYGVIEFEGRMVLAGGDDGAFELIGNKMSVLRDTFAATGTYRLRDRIVFVEPIQDQPRLVVHDPSSSRPWRKWG